jgi:hypothetical protein
LGLKESILFLEIVNFFSFRGAAKPVFVNV